MINHLYPINLQCVLPIPIPDATEKGLYTLLKFNAEPVGEKLPYLLRLRLITLFI